MKNIINEISYDTGNLHPRNYASVKFLLRKNKRLLKKIDDHKSQLSNEILELCNEVNGELNNLEP